MNKIIDIEYYGNTDDIEYVKKVINEDSFIEMNREYNSEIPDLITINVLDKDSNLDKYNSGNVITIINKDTFDKYYFGEYENYLKYSMMKLIVYYLNSECDYTLLCGICLYESNMMYEFIDSLIFDESTYNMAIIVKYIAEVYSKEKLRDIIINNNVEELIRVSNLLITDGTIDTFTVTENYSKRSIYTILFEAALIERNKLK